MRKTKIETQAENWVKNLTDREISNIIESDMRGEVVADNFSSLTKIEGIINIAVLHCYKELVLRSKIK